MADVITYAVGDIHGNYTKLTNLLRHCQQHRGQKAARFVFLGDYIDRGPRSRDVVDLLMKMQADAPDDVVCLRGNHEELAVNAAKGKDVLMWLQNGGLETLESYGVSEADELPSQHLAWFATLPLAISDDKRFFVHAGIKPGVPLQEQAKEVVLWIRGTFLNDERNHGQFIVHGHTPLAGKEPDLRPNRLNLDTGACFGGPLTAAAFDDTQIGPLAFITDSGTVTPAPAIAVPEGA